MDAKRGDWRLRAQRLMDAVTDVVDGRVLPRPPLARAHPDQRTLFARYVDDLRRAKDDADAWWEAIREAEGEYVSSQEELEERLDRNFPARRAGVKGVVLQVRDYWLASVALNARVPDGEQVSPEQFVLGWLMEAGEDELAELVSEYPFWPLGMDEEGIWS